MCKTLPDRILRGRKKKDEAVRARARGRGADLARGRKSLLPWRRCLAEAKASRPEEGFRVVWLRGKAERNSSKKRHEYWAA